MSTSPAARIWLHWGVCPACLAPIGTWSASSENTPVPGVLILRLDAQLYYANALTFPGHGEGARGGGGAQPQALILDASARTRRHDKRGRPQGLGEGAHDQGMAVYAAEVHAPVIEFARRSGLLDGVGTENITSLPSTLPWLRFRSRSGRGGPPDFEIVQIQSPGRRP